MDKKDVVIAALGLALLFSVNEYGKLVRDFKFMYARTYELEKQNERFQTIAVDSIFNDIVQHFD